LKIQEILADTKVSARQQCVFVCVKAPNEEIYSKSTMCDFLLMINSNLDRRNTVCEILLSMYRLKIAIFTYCIMIVEPSSNISVIYRSLKSTFNVLYTLQFTPWQCGSLFL